MTRDEAIAIIKEGMHFRQDTLRDQTIIRRMKEAQEELQGAMTAPWFMKLEDEVLTTVPGQQYLDLPSPFWKEVEDELPRTTDPTTLATVFLQKERFDFAVVATQTTIPDGLITPGAPRKFVRRKDRLYFFPTPDIEYTILWSYYTREPEGDFDNDVADNLWLNNIPYLIIGRAGMLVTEDTDDTQAFEKFTKKYVFWKEHLMAQIIEHEDQGRPYSMGRDH